MKEPDALAKVPGSDFLALASTEQGNRLSEILKENFGPRGITPSDLPRIKIPAGGSLSWELDDDETAKSFDAVILAHREGRRYYKDRQVQEGKQPDCYSPDTFNGYGDPGGECDACPLSQWGTAVNEKGKPTRGQACQLRHMMLLLRPGNLLPIVLSASPGSLKQLNRYLMRLSTKAIGHGEVVTSFALEATKSQDGVTYAQLSLKMARQLTPAEYKGMVAYTEAVAPAWGAVRDTSPDE